MIRTTTAAPAAPSLGQPVPRRDQPADLAEPDLPALRRTEPTDLHHLARRLACRTALWAPHVRFAHDSRWSVRVAVTDTYEAWLLTWLPGQSTGLHDHGGVPGAFAVLEGAVHESTLAPRGHALPVSLVQRTIPTGRVRAFGPHLVHDVANTGRVPAVSLHVYAPALESMRRFVIDDRGRLQVVAREESGRDW